MSSRRTHDGVEKVYQAAQNWLDCALRTDDSLFTPGKAIWSSRWLGELRERFLDRPDEWRGPDFFSKLEILLAGSPPEVYQLMGEVIYVSYLIVWRGAIGGARKKQRIDQVLGWSETPAEIPGDCVDGLTPGIAHPGAFFTANFPLHPGYIIEFVEQWKEREPDERLLDYKDPEAARGFKEFVRGVDWRGVLQNSYPNSPTAQQEALLHLVHPDTFEAILSVDHKNRIAATFAHLVTEQAEDVDRRLMQIRQGLEAEFGRGFNYYEDPIYTQWWNSTPSPWDEFVKRAQAYIDTGQIESEEIDYKVEIGRKLAAAREAVLGDADDWASLTKSGIGGNLIYSVQQAKFRDWIDESSDDALKALAAIWTQDDLSVGERVDAFSIRLPPSEMSGSGTRMNVASVLLMGLDVERYPPFGVNVFNDAYTRTSYDQPEQDADERTLYEHALGFLDRFIEEASDRGLTLRHRLDAQSVVWALHHGRDDTTEEDSLTETQPPLQAQPPSLQELASDLYLPADFLQEIETLLDDKLQVIFQGPPGTGKTYVAQKLAKHLAGSGERVTLVQLHPSYAYEDFVQGFRPTLVDGRPGFEMRDGPLLRAAKLARQEPDAKHFLVIDEINRGSLAKVFGELYFLLEYRDEKIRLQYQRDDEEDFSLPKNLYIIGTMNTADRSIALVDLALRRRFYFVEFHPDDEPVKGVLRRWLEANAPDDMEWLAEVVEQVNKLLEDDRHAAIGPSYFMKPGLNDAKVKRIWKHSVLPYIEELRFGRGENAERFGLDGLRRAVASKTPDDDEGEDGEGDAAD